VITEHRSEDNSPEAIAAVLKGALGGNDRPADPAMEKIARTLRAAAAKGDAKPWAALVKKGPADVLIWAAAENQLDILQGLLAAGADPNAPSEAQLRPLHLAAERGHADAVKTLLAAGAAADPPPPPPEARKKTLRNLLRDDTTPLLQAAKRGHAGVVRALLAAGADRARTAQDGLTPYDWALKNKHAEAAALLRPARPRGAGPTLPEFLAAAEAGDTATLAAGLAAGIPVDAKDKAVIDDTVKGGRTALMLAAGGGHVAAVEHLLAAGAAVDAVSDDLLNGQKTALHYAAETGAVEVVRRLLAAGARVKIAARQFEGSGGTPLHAAAKHGHLPIVTALLAAGAKADDATGGQTPLHLAAAAGHLPVMSALLAANAKVDKEVRSGSTALMAAASGGHVAAVRLLLEHGANPNYLAKEGTALASATHGLWSKTIVYDKKGRRKIQEAGDPVEVMRLLLAAGATPNLAHDGDAPVLTSAARSPAAVKLLLAHGADPHRRDRDGNTALWWAAGQNAPESVALLLAAGADPNAVDAEGKTALDVVLLHKLQSVTALLRQAGGQKGAALKAGKAVVKERRAADRDRRKEAAARHQQYLAMLPDFATRAKRPAFKEAVKKVASLVKAPATAEADLPGLAFFSTTRAAARTLVRKHQPALLKKGCYLFSCGRALMDDDADTLALAPTADKYHVLLALGTGDPNGGRNPLDIREQLQALEKDQPFTLWHISHDRLEGTWTAPIKSPKAFAERLYDFCSDIFPSGKESIDYVANALKKSNTLYFWWD
jgi:ankyrin repeat protein